METKNLPTRKQHLPVKRIVIKLDHQGIKIPKYTTTQADSQRQ
jgi:hypothetical protein